jgi:hypothetical protein
VNPLSDEGFTITTGSSIRLITRMFSRPPVGFIVLASPSYGNIMKILCVGQDTICVSSWESEGAFIAKSFDTGGTWKHIFVTDNQNGCVSDIAISSNYIEYFEMGKFKK